MSGGGQDTNSEGEVEQQLVGEDNAQEDAQPEAPEPEPEPEEEPTEPEAATSQDGAAEEDGDGGDGGGDGGSTDPTETHSPVYLELQDVTNPPAAPAADWTSWLQRLGNAHLRPFQHARLIVLSPETLPKSQFAEERPMTGGDAGMAYDAYGAKGDQVMGADGKVVSDPMVLAPAEPLGWTEGGKAGGAGYAAENTFLGWTDQTQAQIEGECGAQVGSRVRYSLVGENCWHFAMGVGHAICLDGSEGYYNYFLNADQAAFQAQGLGWGD